MSRSHTARGPEGASRASTSAAVGDWRALQDKVADAKVKVWQCMDVCEACAEKKGLRGSARDLVLQETQGTRANAERVLRQAEEVLGEVSESEGTLEGWPEWEGALRDLHRDVDAQSAHAARTRKSFKLVGRSTHFTTELLSVVRAVDHAVGQFARRFGDLLAGLDADAQARYSALSAHTSGVADKPEPARDAPVARGDARGGHLAPHDAGPGGVAEAGRTPSDLSIGECRRGPARPAGAPAATPAPVRDAGAGPPSPAGSVGGGRPGHSRHASHLAGGRSREWGEEEEKLIREAEAGGQDALFELGAMLWSGERGVRPDR